MRAVVVTRRVHLASSVERVWPFVSDTERFNRLIGMSGVRFRAIEPGTTTSARFVGETRAGGFKLVYEEFPFEWTHQRSFGVHRRMRGGPVESYAWRCTLEPTTAAEGDGALEGGTRATVRFEITPRSEIFRPVAWLNGRSFTAKFAALGAAIDAHVGESAPSPYTKPASAAHAERLDAAVAQLATDGVRKELALRLDALVRHGADADVVRMRPFELADAWGEDRREVLRAFLRAVPAGLMEMRWGIICPSCLTASQQAAALADIAAEGHCQLCDITFELDLDRAVEATFLPHPAIRPAPDAIFCIGGPSRTPHVLVQATIGAAVTRAIDVPREPGRYRLFVRGGATAALQVDAPGSGGEPEHDKPRAVRISPDAVEPAQLRCAPGDELTVTSACPDERHLKIERVDFANKAATGAIVSTMGDFRQLFSSDLVKRTTPLKVARAAILFSDLTGSTALYAQLGDAAAFRLVDDHFDVLRAVVDAHDGVLVKTMGDAVMAAFVDAHACARAAADALARFETFRAAHPQGALVGLKVGLFAGACYVVTANGALDYFGQTVNVASRVQHLAGSGEVVMAHGLWESLPEAERSRFALKERFRANVKGVVEALDLARVGLSEGA
jgi:class 3 adenylate cyclase